MRKILAFVLVLLIMISVTAVGFNAQQTQSEEKMIYFRVPDDWQNFRKIFCHITIKETGYSIYGYMSKKESCTEVDDGLWAYDLSDIVIMDEYEIEFMSNVGHVTYPLMFRYENLGCTAYCDGTQYQTPYNMHKEVYAAYWEGVDPVVAGPVINIGEDGEIIGVCRSEYNEVNQEIFKKFLKNRLDDVKELTNKTDQQLIDDIIDALGISESTADIIIRSIGGIKLDWNGGYGGEEKPAVTWKYRVEDEKAIITGCTIHGSDLYELDVPESVDGLSVVGIDSETFFRFFFNEYTINIPASVTEISTPVFSEYSSVIAINVSEDNPVYSSLDGVLYSKDKKTLLAYSGYKKDKIFEMSAGVVTIEEKAFLGADFDTLVLPETLEVIKSGAFDNCVWLKTLNVPASVKDIEPEVFSMNRNLTAVNVDANNKSYCSVDGVLYNKDKTEMIYYPIAKTDTSYTVQDGVKKIASRAFQAFSSLDEVELPDSVESIGYRAFYGCGVQVDIPENVKFIDEEAFCVSGITKAIIPKGITEIKYRTFYNNDITVVELPKGLTHIGKEAFAWNRVLSSVNLPDTVTVIDEAAFQGCSTMDEVIIPESVKEIGANAFADCSANFVIIGYGGTAAEKYANDNNIRFIDLSSSDAFKVGDVNLDGQINIKDATAIQKHIADLVVISDSIMYLADYDADNKVTIKDATAIQKFIAGIV